jgi:hypothetical protein
MSAAWISRVRADSMACWPCRREADLLRLPFLPLAEAEVECDLADFEWLEDLEAAECELAFFLVEVCVVLAAEIVTSNNKAQPTPTAFVEIPWSETTPHLGYRENTQPLRVKRVGPRSEGWQVLLIPRTHALRGSEMPAGVEHHLAFDAATPAGRLLNPLRKGTGHKDSSAILAGASGLN